MEIVKLDPVQKEKAAKVVSAAFFDYPMFKIYFPDPKKRARLLPWYFGNYLNCGLRYGDVFTTPDIAGVLCVLPPGHTKISQFEYIQNGYLFTPFVLGLLDYIRSTKCDTFIANAHDRVMKGRPHYYLWGLTVDPSQQRKGVGTALLTPVIEKADSTKMPIYLETHDENNVTYYERLGFTLVEIAKYQKCDMTVWCMVREPI